MLKVNELLAEGLLRDAAIRFGIRQKLASTLRKNKQPNIEVQKAAMMRHVAELKGSSVAIVTAEANEQHYEVPARFYQFCLGKHLQYSIGYWPEPTTTFDESEAIMLGMTCERAELRVVSHYRFIKL